MKRFFALVLFFSTLLFAFYLLAPKIVSSILTHRFQTKVVVKNIKFNQNGLTLEKISIKNPKNSTIKEAFFAREVVIKSPLSSIMSKIELIAFNDVTINVEMYDSSTSNNNWNKILSSHLASKPGKKFLIKTLEINNIALTMTSPNSKTKELPKIATIRLTNINTSSFNKIEQAIVNAIVDAAFKNQNLDFLLSPTNLFKLPLFFW